jgi:hypothetical protein
MGIRLWWVEWEGGLWQGSLRKEFPGEHVEKMTPIERDQCASVRAARYRIYPNDRIAGRVGARSCGKNLSQNLRLHA